MRCIARHCLHLTNSSPSIMGIDHAITFSKSQLRFFIGFKSGDCDGYCRIFLDIFCNHACCRWNMSYAWNHCPGRMFNDIQCSASLHYDVFSQDFLIIQNSTLPSTLWWFPCDKEFIAAPDHYQTTIVLNFSRPFFSAYTSFFIQTYHWSI